MADEFVHYLRDGSPLFYTLRRRRGMKRLYLYVIEGRVEVRSAPRVSFEEIEALLRDKESWILDKLQSTRGAITLEGLTRDFLYLGKRYPLRKRIDPDAGTLLRLVLDEDRSEAIFHAACDPSVQEIWELFNRFYRRNAPAILQPRTLEWSRRMELTPRRLIYRRNKSRWGSCSSRGTVSLNTRLLLLPESLRDYVIVHELAHLEEMNHSERFWAIVARHLPDYRARRQSLREYEKYLR